MSSNVAEPPEDQIIVLLDQLGDHLNSSGSKLEGYAAASGIAQQMLDAIQRERSCAIAQLLVFTKRVYGNEWSEVRRIQIGDRTIESSSPTELLEVVELLNLLPELDKALSDQAVSNYQTADES